MNRIASVGGSWLAACAPLAWCRGAHSWHGMSVGTCRCHVAARPSALCGKPDTATPGAGNVLNLIYSGQMQVQGNGRAQDGAASLRCGHLTGAQANVCQGHCATAAG